MKKFFLLLAVAVAMIVTSCNMLSPYGKKIKINDKIEVYIRGDSTTEADAKKLGAYIAETWKESKSNKSFQLQKDKNVYTVKMVVDAQKFKSDSTLDGSFQLIRMLIEEQVFKGSKVKLVLTNNKFADIKTYEPDNDVSSPTTKENNGIK